MCIVDEPIYSRIDDFFTGKIVRDSDLFQDERFTWPEGYTAVRKYTSVTGGAGDLL